MAKKKSRGRGKGGFGMGDIKSLVGAAATGAIFTVATGDKRMGALAGAGLNGFTTKKGIAGALGGLFALEAITWMNGAFNKASASMSSNTGGSSGGALF